MKNSFYIINKFINKINKIHFDKNLRLILKTKAITPGKTKCSMLSMVHHRDVKSYLLAVKSICRFISPEKIIVVTDPSIDSNDISLIKEHILGASILQSNLFHRANLPTGGTWERLSAISEFAKDEFIIQLDADTVTKNVIKEVELAVEANRSFMLGTEDNQTFLTSTEAASWAQAQLRKTQHVQVLSESFLDQLPGGKTARYARGCSGFAGFARGSLSPEKLEILSQVMKMAIKDRINDWGTEQFASNYIVANSQKAFVLPHPKYCHAGRETIRTAFLHFIGFVRFNTNRYALLAKEISQLLNSN